MREAPSVPTGTGSAAAPPVAKRPALAALTGLRFFAAAHVVLYHYAGPALPQGTPDGLRHAVAHGYVGVSFFYLLSGFILAYNYAERRAERSVALRGSVRAFLWNRVSRVYPLYLVAWLASAPFVVAHRLAADPAPVTRAAKLFVSAAVSLGLVQAWLPGAHTWWNPPAWSISVEALFYVAFPVLLPRLLAPGRSRVAHALFLYALALIGPALYVGFGRGDTLLAAVKYGPLLHLPTFGLGILLADGLESPHRERLARMRVPLGVAAALVLALVLRTAPGPTYLLIHNGLLAPAFGALLLSVALGLPGFSRVCASAPLVLLGEASFGLYILQAPAWLAWRRMAPALAPLVDVALFFVLLVALSILAHRAVELPAQRRLRRYRLGMG